MFMVLKQIWPLQVFGCHRGAMSGGRFGDISLSVLPMKEAGGGGKGQRRWGLTPQY